MKELSHMANRELCAQNYVQSIYLTVGARITTIQEHCMQCALLLQLLDGNLSQLTAYLNDESTAPGVLRIFIEVSNSEPQHLVDLLPTVSQMI